MFLHGLIDILLSYLMDSYSHFLKHYESVVFNHPSLDRCQSEGQEGWRPLFYHPASPWPGRQDRGWSTDVRRLKILVWLKPSPTASCFSSIPQLLLLNATHKNMLLTECVRLVGPATGCSSCPRISDWALELRNPRPCRLSGSYTDKLDTHQKKEKTNTRHRDRLGRGWEWWEGNW